MQMLTIGGGREWMGEREPPVLVLVDGVGRGV